MANKNIDDLPVATTVNSGDKVEILQGGTNKQADAILFTDSGGTLGLVQIVDLAGDFFTDLATATAYIQQFYSGAITDESFNDGVYYFTVPIGSDFSNDSYFLGVNAGSITAYLIDSNNLVSVLGDYAFKNNSSNNLVSSPLFGIEAFASASGVNLLTDIAPTFGDDAFNSFGGVVTFYGTIANTTGNYFGQGATGKFNIFGKFSALSCDSTLFFTGSTSTILADKYYFTNNAGGIDACLVNAIAEGCNVQFDGIDLATIASLTSKANLASPTFTGTVTTPAIIVSSETASTIASFDASKNIKSLSTGTYPSLTELSYSKGATSSIQTQLNNKVGVIVKDITTSSALTGTTSITLIKSVLIPANTFSTGNVVVIQARAIRSTATGTGVSYLYVNTSASLSGATLIGLIGSAVRFYGIERNLFIKSATVSETLDTSVSSNTDAATNNASANSDLNIDWTVDQYIIHAFANAAVGNSTVSSGLIVTKM